MQLGACLIQAADLFKAKDAVFGIARPLVFDPLPYANADSVGIFWMGGAWTEEEFVYMRDKWAGFRSVAAYRASDVTLREGDAPTRLLAGISTSAELFDVLGARPHIGRGFQPGDDEQTAEGVVTPNAACPDPRNIVYQSVDDSAGSLPEPPGPRKGTGTELPRQEGSGRPAVRSRSRPVGCPGVRAPHARGRRRGAR